MNEQLVQRIEQCPSLPSLPAIALQVLELAQKPDADIPEIARVISKDPALSSKILRTVNSTFYGRSNKISTISHALVILGLQSVKTLVLGFSLVSNLTQTKARGFKHVQYWRRSVYAATAARTLADKMRVPQQEECFLGALLMDIGMLVLDQVLGDEYGALHAKAPTHAALATAEAEALGMTHAEVSGVLARQWKLPPLLSAPMAAHHNPDQPHDDSLRRVSQLVYLAGRCADVYADESPGDAIAEARSFALRHLAMAREEWDATMSDIGRRTQEVAPLFEVNLGPDVTYEAILKKANAALVDLTLHTQQQAVSLKVQNTALKKQATTDGLTRLANRAQFDQFIGDAFAAALGSGRPLAMLMLDVDHFKSINDTHGHPAGDQVLRSIARLLAAAARAGELAARYGGEEMALVLPGATRQSAAQRAETIRRALVARPIAFPGGTLPVTASLGVAAFEPGGPFREYGHLVKAADMAVYAAKKSGRNCVRVFSLKPPAAKQGSAA